MKKSKLFYLLGIVLVSTALVFSSCKKDDDPAPAPPAYVPSFSPTFVVIDQGGVDVLDFYITCTTDDWEMIKVIVRPPGGLAPMEYLGNGQIVTSGTPFSFSNYFIKLGGTWYFDITGNIKSGSHLNESFTVTTSLLITGK
jgi:hypothetical protein